AGHALDVPSRGGGGHRRQLDRRLVDVRLAGRGLLPLVVPRTFVARLGHLGALHGAAGEDDRQDECESQSSAGRQIAPGRCQAHRLPLPGRGTGPLKLLLQILKRKHSSGGESRDRDGAILQQGSYFCRWGRANSCGAASRAAAPGAARRAAQPVATPLPEGGRLDLRRISRVRHQSAQKYQRSATKMMISVCQKKTWKNSSRAGAKTATAYSVTSRIRLTTAMSGMPTASPRSFATGDAACASTAPTKRIMAMTPLHPSFTS